MDCRSKARWWQRIILVLGKRITRCRGRVTTIDVLNDDVLLVIFDFCVAYDENQDRTKQAWQSLVHVCQRWRTLVLESPRRLNLRLCCTPITPVKDALDIWPELPLIVKGSTAETGLPGTGTDNIIAALRHSNRVRQVILTDILGWYLDKVLAAMQVPFPELTDLRLQSYPPIIPNSFLGGYAPRLQYVDFDGISFPGLPKLLLSSNHLVNLRLFNIPYAGHVSSDAMVALISVLSSLEALSLGFQSSQFLPHWEIESRSPPPPKRSILPALDQFRFIGDTEYLEDLVTFIDAPQLNYFYITFFSQVDFDTPRLAQFINRTPTLRERDEVHVQFSHTTASVELPAGSGTLKISKPIEAPDWRLQSIEQICNSCLHPLSTVEDLYIERQYPRPVWENDGIENTEWLELLRRFTGVKNLYLSEKFAPCIAAALQELVEGRITEVLPSLQNIFVEGLEPSGPVQEDIGEFVAARQLSYHPIAISVWTTTPK